MNAFSRETRDLDRHIHGTRYFIREWAKINETLKKEPKPRGASRSSAEVYVKKLIPSQGSLCLSQRQYKSPSLARFEERYKRVGTTFIPSRSLSNGLSSFLPFWPEKREQRGGGRERERKKRRVSNLLLAFRLTLSDWSDRPSRIPLLKD